jgi:hypothetical protein
MQCRLYAVPSSCRAVFMPCRFGGRAGLCAVPFFVPCRCLCAVPLSMAPCLHSSFANPAMRRKSWKNVHESLITTDGLTWEQYSLPLRYTRNQMEYCWWIGKIYTMRRGFY